MILNENWKQSLAKMLNRDVNQIEKFFQKHSPSFGQTLALGQAVEQNDLKAVRNIMKTVSTVTEADNPFAAASGRAAPRAPAVSPVSVNADQAASSDGLEAGDEIESVENNVVTVRSADGTRRQASIASIVSIEETTASGAIASGAVSVGSIVKRRPVRKKPNESSTERSKKL